MSISKHIIFGYSICVLFMFAISCTHEPIISPQNQHSINLKWNKAYDSEKAQQVEVGLQWCFSFLGATLPISTYNEAISWATPNVVNINFDKLGLNQTAIQALEQLVVQIKNSEEYKVNQSIDIGRFVALTINASNHYYKITGAKPMLAFFENDYAFDSIKMAIIESTVSKGERLLKLAKGTEVLNWKFVASEIAGSLKNATYTETEFEVMDLMPNGQQRFAIYNQAGNLINAANVLHTNAGKPAKCMWCHEMNIQQSFAAVTSVQGYYSVDSFTTKIISMNTLLSNYRNTLPSKLDYSKKQDHTQMELLYITFMEPSAQRLANEWSITVEEVNNKLAGLSTHLNNEFLLLGELYNRNEVEAFAPFAGIKVADSAREFSVYEPDLID